MSKIIVVAGATGNLGYRIVKALVLNGVEVRALVRPTSASEKIALLKTLGAKIYYVSMSSISEISKACQGAHCVISALAGLREVVIDAQRMLLDGAIAAGVSRFIPSDYSLDYTRFREGENRNLDLRREFHKYLETTSINATTIFNGAFTELITGEMPLVLFKQKLILYWGSIDHKLAFTTMDNTAFFTAKAAIAEEAPRFLHVAGDLASPREIQQFMTQITGEKFRAIRAGGLNFLSVMIKIVRRLSGGERELYPAWQGMQYMRNMIDSRSDMPKLDNSRYGAMVWTSVREVLNDHVKAAHS